jgi:hypothetical protein
VTKIQGPTVRVLSSELGVTFQDITRKAIERAREMAEYETDYQASGPTQNIVGLYGERAAQCWLRQAGFDIDPGYLSGAGPDLVVRDNGTRIEVKTGRASWWSNYGACLDLTQVGRILACDALVWCVTGPELPTNAVRILGWVGSANLASRLRPAVVRGRPSAAVVELDAPETLLSVMRMQRKEPLDRPQRYECGRGHVGYLERCLDCWWRGLGGAEYVPVRGRTFHRDLDCPQLHARTGREFDGAGYASAPAEPAGLAMWSRHACEVCVEPWLDSRTQLG